MCAHHLGGHGLQISATASAAKTQVKKLFFRNSSSCILVGVLKESASPSKCCVLLCHGYASYKDGFQLPVIAETLAAAGYNSFRWVENCTEHATSACTCTISTARPAKLACCTPENDLDVAFQNSAALQHDICT